MDTPARTIALFYYRRDHDLLIPTSGSLRPAEGEEASYDLNHGWVDELGGDEYCVNLVVAGFDCHNMTAMMNQMSQFGPEWEEQARHVLHRKFPDSQIALPPASQQEPPPGEE